MKTFGHAIVAARKNAGLTQKAVAPRLRRSDGRAVMRPYLNDLENDRRRPPENTVIEQLAQVLNVSPDFLYFYARRLPANIEGDFDEGCIEAAYRAFRKELKQAPATEVGTQHGLTRTQALGRKARDGIFQDCGNARVSRNWAAPPDKEIGAALTNAFSRGTCDGASRLLPELTGGVLPDDYG